MKTQRWHPQGNKQGLLPETAVHVMQRRFCAEPSLQQLLFAFSLFAAASHLDNHQGKKKKKEKNHLLLLNKLSIKTKPEQQPRAGRLFCLMLNIPWLASTAAPPKCCTSAAGPRARLSTRLHAGTEPPSCPPHLC